MTFAGQTIDPRWHHRRRGPRKTGERGVQLPTAIPEPRHYDHASVARALPFSAGVATTFSHPAAEVIAQEKNQNRSNRRVLALRPRRVEGAPFGRVEDLHAGGRAAGDPAAAGLGGRAQLPGEVDEKGWKEGLLGYGARVLALSVSSSK